MGVEQQNAPKGTPTLEGGNDYTLGSLGYMWQQCGMGACSAASHQGVRLEGDVTVTCPSLRALHNRQSG